MENKNKHDTKNTLSHWYNFRMKLVFQGVIIGILAALLIVAYRFSLEKIGQFASFAYNLQKSKPILIPLWIIILIVIAYIVGLMVKKEPMISGSGIPQVEGVLLRRLSMNWWRVILGKFIGGVLALGAGLSLGREGPSIQLGAAVGQGFSKIFKRIKVEEKYLITSGASAGLAAAFNAPLAGVMFALEEVHKNFSPLVLISAMSASLAADFVSKEFLGLKPVFDFNELKVLPLNHYFYVIMLGIILGVLGVVFNSTLLRTQRFYEKLKWLPQELKPVIPFLLAGILGLTLPEVLGGGHELVGHLVNNGMALKMLIIILIAKFMFTMLSFGSGVPGGIFLPLLVIGALTGDIYGNVLVKFFGLDANFITNFIVLAMTGYFAAIVRAPITGSILITEMTGSFNHLLALTIVSIAAYITADLMGSKPIYESLLDRILEKKGFEDFSGDSRVKVILEAAVCMDTPIDGKMVREIKWPSNCLLVGIRRGEKEIIPKGNVKIYAGDYLIALADECKEAQIKEELLSLVGGCIIE